MNDKYNIPKMRTVDSAYDELKRLDPKSDFTKRALRRMISTGELKTVKIGNKHLINFDLLLEILSCGLYNKTDTCTSIRG